MKTAIAMKGRSSGIHFPSLATALVIAFWGSAAPAAAASVDNAIFAALLGRYTHAGQVDYAGFKREERRLDAYLDILAAADPSALTRNGQFAFYINAYNAWTIKLILSAYPGIRSIKELGSLFRSPWKKKFARIDGETVSLDHIEHEILRPRFRDPRVHFAINCASRGCPPLAQEPYDASRLDEQLDAAARRFVNDPQYNRLEGETLYVSSIFKWFAEDFGGDIVGFFIRHVDGGLKARLAAAPGRIDIRYLDYDWSLNGR